MRNTIAKLFAAIAVVTASAAPAMACGNGLFSTGCSPCEAYASPCAPSYQPTYGGYGYGSGYGYAGVVAYERLPDPTPSRYYYANQGPSFSGPGQFAPYPTYQETALSGPRGYYRPNYGYYDGGPYGNATNHYSYAQPAYRSPVVYSFQDRQSYRARPSYRYGYRMQPRFRHGYGHRSYATRYAHPHRYHHQRPLRRMY